jgi:hypothetical protein
MNKLQHAFCSRFFCRTNAQTDSIEANPRHPSLNTHKFNAMFGPGGEDVFEAYAENNTPGSYRIFWHYGPGKDVITIIAITPHP